MLKLGVTAAVTQLSRLHFTFFINYAELVIVFVVHSILINPSLVCSTFRSVKKIGMKLTRELLDFPQDKDT